MGNNISCVQKASARNHREDSYIAPNPTVVAPAETKPEASPSAVQHILDREMQDNSDIPSDNAQVGTLFLSKSMTPTRKREREQRKTTDSPETNGNLRWSKKFSSCSTIFLDDSTVSQPNLKNTLKCVALAIHFIVLNREGNRTIDIFDELKHPLTRDPVPHDYAVRMPEQSHIYRFLRMLFKAAQLTAECAIVTLIYLERLLKYAEVDLCPANWKRILLASIMLASKVWDDQAVWNVDYCQILRDLTVDDMNSLERDFLAHLDFNINVPSSVYAKYYFDLRLLAEQSGIALSTEPLTKDKAAKLEAFSSICAAKAKESYAAPAQPRRAASLETLHANNRRSIAILS